MHTTPKASPQLKRSSFKGVLLPTPDGEGGTKKLKKISLIGKKKNTQWKDTKADETKPLKREVKETRRLSLTKPLKRKFNYKENLKDVPATKHKKDFKFLKGGVSRSSHPEVILKVVILTTLRNSQ